MSRQRFPEESTIEAVTQLTECGNPIARVTNHLGASAHSLYQWRKRYSPKHAKSAKSVDQQNESRRLKAELKRDLALLLDLRSRQVIGWSMQSRIDGERVQNALLMALWRRQPKQEVLVHSKQGRRFSSSDWQDFLKAHRLMPSMSLRGN